MTNKPSNLEQRISERRDPTDTVGDAGDLAKLIAADREAANLDKAYARLGQMLNGWRRLPDSVDFRAFHTNVAGAVAADVEYRALVAHEAGQSPDVVGLTAEEALQLTREYAKTDDAIRAAAGPLPAVDWNALKTRISAAVHNEATASDPHHERTILLPAAKAPGATDKHRNNDARGRRYRHPLQRFALPLSAAAAIALTATLWLNRGRTITPSPAPILAERIVVQLGAPTTTGSVQISFDESPMTAAAAEDLPTRGAAIAVGPGHDEASLLVPDDALWQ